MAERAGELSCEGGIFADDVDVLCSEAASRALDSASEELYVFSTPAVNDSASESSSLI